MWNLFCVAQSWLTFFGCTWSVAIAMKTPELYYDVDQAVAQRLLGEGRTGEAKGDTRIMED